MSTTRTAQLGFYGGVGSVTGANFLLDAGACRVLVDCGLVQGGRFGEKQNAESFAYDPKSIDALVVTHAHADHIGRIPKLVRDGFAGIIYSTAPTKDLAEVMLADAYRVMASEAKKHNEEPIYDPSDVDRALSLWKGVSYKERIVLRDEVSFLLYDAGHILGSAFIEFERGGRTIVFSGDIGNVPQPLLDAPDVPSGYHYLVMESVYGDRAHEEVAERADMLLGYIKDTIESKGTLIIPAFSLERTQGMLYEINNFVEHGLIPPVPTYLDSPLAIEVTGIYRKHVAYLKKEVQEQIRNGDDIFDFPKLSFTERVADSRDIVHVKGPKIIIAGSGMSHGGRINMHEKEYLDDANTTLLLVGFQAVGSIGRILQDGAKKVRIDGEEVKVRARVATIRGYSGHADRDGLVDFVERGGDQIEKVFVTMGEEKASLFLVQRLRDYLGVDANAPEAGSTAEIRF
jgi:metallo-beta-lactamase family protein